MARVGARQESRTILTSRRRNVQALVIDRDAPDGIRFVPDYPQPGPAPGEVLLRVRLAGICATDLQLVRGYMGFAGVPGHEFVGRVETGPPTLQGRRVVAEINCVPPGSPADTLDVRKHAPDRTVLGIQGRDGAFAEFVTVPAENCHVVPDGISDVQAVFVEPLAAACQVVRDCPQRGEDRVAVLGSGRLGILCAQVLALHGPHVDVLGRNPRTLDLCRRLALRAGHVDEVPPGATYDIVVECTGSPEGLRRALRLVRPRGTVVLKSTYAGAERLDLAPAVVNEVRIFGSRCGPFDEALDLLRRGRVQVEPLVTARYPLARGVEAFRAAASPEHIKVLLEPPAA